MASVSIIIPVYNEQRHIWECLTTLVQQTLDCEIIVVDDGSTDRTVEIVRTFSNITLFQQNHHGPALARNLGARHASGDIIVFCDADQTFEPDYVEKLIAPIVNDEAIGTYSREEYIANYDNVWARCYNIDAEIYSNSRHHPDTPLESLVFRAIPRKIFCDVGGYENLGYDDDHTVGEKIDTYAIPAPGARCYHYNPDTLSEVFDQASWYAKGRQVGKGCGTVFYYTPLVTFIGCLKRAIRTRTPQFIIYRIVHGLGVIAGIISWNINRGRHAR